MRRGYLSAPVARVRGACFADMIKLLSLFTRGCRRQRHSGLPPVLTIVINVLRLYSKK